MTCLRSISRLVVVFMTLASVTAAAVPAGWIALRYDPPSGADQKGHWIIVKEPADGLGAWWSDAEIARIVANDPDYVKRLETDWSPVDHPVADADEAERLAEELARYWGGDVPQANYWAHGAMVRRGSTLEAYRWTQDGPAQRTSLEQAGERPQIPAAALDPDPVDQRYDNQADVVTYGDRWGDHLLTGTLDHVYQAELNKAKRRHHPNSPPTGEVAQKSRETVEACRTESLKAEMGVFENYVRGWGGLAAKSVSFSLPANCVVDPGPPTPYIACDGSRHATQQAADAVQCITDPPNLYTACDGSRHATQEAADAVQCITDPPDLYTACDGSRHATQQAADAVQCITDPPDLYTACDGSKHATQEAADAVQCITDPPDLYTACDGSKHATQEAADAVQCITDPPDLYTACDGSKHATQEAADAVQCITDPPDLYTACDGSKHATQEAADAVQCITDPPDLYTACDGSRHATQEAANAVQCTTDPPDLYTACDGSKHATQQAADAVQCTTDPSECKIAWLCGNNPDPDPNDPDPDTEDGTDTGGGNGGNGGGGGGNNPPIDDYEACDGSMHSSQAAADAVSCDPPLQPQEYFDCQGGSHSTQAAADAVSCEITYTACDGSEHKTQAAADSVDCSLQERQQILHDLTCEGTVDEDSGQCDELIRTP